MRNSIALLIGFVSIAPSACASLTNLAGGVLIAHYEAQVQFSLDPPAEGWCQAYEPFAISDPTEQVNRVDVATATGIVWYVLAAWDEEKQWCAVEYGLGEFSQDLFDFTDWGPCFPSMGIEIPIPSGWPRPDCGTAFVIIDEPWIGACEAVYFFAGYVYPEAGPGVIPLSLDPCPSPPFGGTGNCTDPGHRWEAECFGALGINTEGIFCNPPDIFSVCCIGIECHILSEEQCIQAGGTYHPEWEHCDPNPCGHTPVEVAHWGTIKALYRP
ncbi:MAG: hypothetical protein KAY24_12040 [Candidatus Eisenbacteria sp.]|nr:hypothetical protein [Candidatus Eisenbacteria bacterium]